MKGIRDIIILEVYNSANPCRWNSSERDISTFFESLGPEGLRMRPGDLGMGLGDLGVGPGEPGVGPGMGIGIGKGGPGIGLRMRPGMTKSSILFKFSI